MHYYPGSIAAREPYVLDIIHQDKNQNLVTRDHLNLLQFKIKNGQTGLKPAFAAKILKALRTSQDLEVEKQRAAALRKHSRLDRNARLQKTQDDKAANEKKAKPKAAKSKHLAKTADATDAKKRRLDDHDASGDDTDEEGTGESSPTVKKQKTAAAKGKAVHNGKAWLHQTANGISDVENEAEFDDDTYNQVDAQTDSEPDDETETDCGVFDVMAQLEALIVEGSSHLNSRSAEDLWEKFNVIPPGKEAQYQAEIEKRLKLQKDWMSQQYLSREKVPIKAYILSLPLEGFMWDRVVVDEAQVLRNIESGSSRYIRLLLQHSRAFHMLSATPTLNSIIDIRALASLA